MITTCVVLLELGRLPGLQAVSDQSDTRLLIRMHPLPGAPDLPVPKEASGQAAPNVSIQNDASHSFLEAFKL